IERQRALEPALRRLEVTRCFFGEAQLHQRAKILGMIAEQLRELGDRLRRTSKQCKGATQLPSRLPIRRGGAQPTAERRHAPIVVAGAEIRDFEIALRDQHLLVEFECARERRNRFLEEALVEIEYAEVVVRARMR